MSAMELYTAALCPYAQRVRLALAEKGLAATEIEIDPRNRPDDFLSLSPAGTVPLLVRGDTRVWESSVVLEYLEDVFPEPPLLPEDPGLRAAARIWLNFADVRLYAPTHRLLVNADPGVQAEMAQTLATALRSLEDHALATHDGPYILGEAFGLADIALFPWFEQFAVLERFRGFRMPAECVRIAHWRQAVARRDGIRSAARPPNFYLDGYAQLFAR